jgi:O-antigen/teichoic acid export membrane protein
MPLPSVSHRAGAVARNVTWNLGTQAWFLVLGLATTPYVVHRLGAAGFGLYAIVGTIAGYLAVLDLGLGMATVKYISEFNGREDTAAVQRLIGTAVAAYVGLGAVGAGILAVLAPPLARLLGVASMPHGTAVLELAAAGFLLAMPLSFFNAVPTALQRLDVTNRRNLIFGTINITGAVALLVSGHGLLAVVAFGLVVDAAALVWFVRAVRRLLPGVSLRPRLDIRTLRLLAGFGGLKFANQVSTQSVYHLDKLLIGALASVSAVAWFAVPVLVAQRLAAVVGNVASAFLPAASELHGASDRPRFDELYLRATKLVALLVLPLALVLVVDADPLLRAWLGDEFARRSATPMRLLAVAYAVNAFSTIPALACDSIGRPRVTTAFSVLSAALNLVLSVALIPRYGAVGASISVLVNSVVLVPIFLVYVHRRVLQSSVVPLLRRSLLRPTLATVIAAGPAVVAVQLGAVPAAVVTVAAYLVAAVMVGVFDATDKALLRAQIRRARPQPA